MKLRTGLLVAGCAAAVTVLSRRGAQSSGILPLEPAENEHRLSEDFEFLNSRIKELVQDPNATMDDLLELQPICLRYDLAQRDADIYGRVPEHGMTAVLTLAVVAKAIEKVVS